MQHVTQPAYLEEGRSPVIHLVDPLLEPYGVTVAMRREDLLHPWVSGNKWRKLKYNLEAARAGGYDTLLSFGGAYSNHIHALAYAGRELDFNTIGVIRGEDSVSNSTTLREAQAWGMRLHPVTRTDYRRRHDPRWWDELQAELGPCYILPEGGSNTLALRGVGEFWLDLPGHHDYLAVAAGTGATAAGLITAAPATTEVLVFPVLRGGFMEAAVLGFLEAAAVTAAAWRVVAGYEGAGYARIDARLLAFMDRFERRHGIPLDPVYTGKLMYGVYDQVRSGVIPSGSSVLAIHSGGLQGRAGMAGRYAELRQAGDYIYE